MKAIKLRTEYLINPVGIDIKNPTLYWNCEGLITQTAYRVVAKSSLGKEYDSGKVISNDMHHTYPLELSSREIITWQVQLWDENDKESELSEHAYFEMGLLNDSDWVAKWISGNYKVNRNKRYPVDCFKKEFDINNIKHARLYATACGLYEVELNGKRVGDFVLAPGVTNYKLALQYQTYDVLDLLKDGKNTITASLGDGLYRGSCGAWGLKNQYGTQTKLLLQLELTDNNGIKTIVSSDETWLWSNDGEIRFDDNKDGEIVDANMIPSYSGKALVTRHNVVPTSSNNVKLSEHEIFAGKLITTPSGKKVIDFSQNISGYVSFTLEAKKGDKIFMRFGELIDNDGEFTQKNIQLSMKNKTTPLQQVDYICKDGKNEYKTRFAIFGFRYVLVESNIDFKVDDFKAIAVYSNMEETIKFDSSNDLLNKLVNCTIWSAKNNHADLPTDCPTRERHGWTGDAQIFANTAGYIFNYASFARKYERMLVVEQTKKGVYPQIVPSGGVDFYMKVMDGSSGWADAGILIPYRMWKLYGDEKIIKDNYESMKKYANYLISKIGKWYITATKTGLKGQDKKDIVNYGQAYGEWAEPDEIYKTTWKDCAVPHPEVSTAYTSYVLSLMSEISEHFGKNDDAKLFSENAKRLKRGYQKLSNTEKFSLDTRRQARLIRPLYFNLLDDEQTKYAKERLVKALEDFNWKIGTGFLSTPLILFVLQNINIEYAYRLLENEEMPGWLFMPKSGSTTIWEAWEGNSTENSGIASLNHYSKGAVCEWIFTEMCGIKVKSNNCFEISPKIGGHFKYASCEYDSVYGKVKSSWRREKDKTIYEIEVPSNTTAKFVVGNVEKQLTFGKYSFEL